MALTRVSYSMIQDMYLNVLDFGADNTGATDCTAAFTTALAEAFATKKVLFIPSGTYKASIAVGAGQTKITIVGESRETTIIEAKNNSTATISIHWTAFNCNIKSLTVKNTSGGNNGTHYGIHSLGAGSGSGASGLVLEDLVVSGYNINVKLDEFNDQYVRQCVFASAVAGGSPAPAGANLYAGSPTYPCVGLIMDQVYCIAGEYGMYLENTEGIKLTHLDCVLSVKQGLIHQRTTGNTIGMTISDSYFDSTTLDGLYLEGVDYGSFTNIWCSASPVAGTGNGVQLVNCSYNMFTNLATYNCKAAGLLLLQDCTSNTFVGCMFRSNATYGARIVNDSNSLNIFNGCFSSGNTVGAIEFLDTTAGAPNYWLNSIASGTVTIQDKDIKQGGNASGGITYSLTYQKNDLPDGASSSVLDFTSGQAVFVAPTNGNLLSISVALNDTRAAGTLYARPTINGAAKDLLRAEINGTNTQYAYVNVTSGAVPVSAGELIRVFYDTDAGWDTTGGAGTVDIAVTLVFESR